MKRFTLPLLFLLIATVSSAQLVDTKWTITALGVGPGQYDYSWWSLTYGDRVCFENDTVVFSADGTFEIMFGDDTWIETWQGAAAEGCGALVAPYDGSVAATWALDGTNLTLSGKGAYLTVPKGTNTGEISDVADAPETTVYIAEFDATEEVMTISIETGTGSGTWWNATYAKVVPPVSIQQRTVKAISVYPTFATDYITVEADAKEYTIVNAVGRVVKTSVKNTIDVNDLASGMYFVRIPNGVAKFIVQ